MTRMLSLILACACAAQGWSAPPALMGGDVALGFAGETTPNGSCTVSIVPAPDAPAGTFCLEARFRITRHQAGDWIDCSVSPAPPLDFTAASVTRLWIRPAQSSDYLHIKLVDPENPGPNHAALEEELTLDGNPLPADTWTPLDLPLPAADNLKDGLTYVGFYIPAFNAAVPLNQDLVFHIGRFEYRPPPRPPWPPQADTAAGTGATSLWQGPMTQDSPWLLVRGEDIQTDHTAAFEEGTVHFNADADGWNEFLWSDSTRLELRPKTTYQLQFDYEILRPATGEDATFYSLVRAPGTIQMDVGWQRWSPPAGTTGRRSMTFTTQDSEGYYIIFGIRNQGEIRLSNIAVRRLDAP